ncbi:MAG: hypothetical protein PHW60_16550 [Kiritimatiellae bacterium]|nr:hypothetical protein [Kiritimatiellia bacterium]
MELMVVVAIISLLLMLLVPNIRTMREKAWSVQCQNNLRQYGITMNQYMFAATLDTAAGGAYGKGLDQTKYADIRTRDSVNKIGLVGPPTFSSIIPYLPDNLTLADGTINPQAVSVDSLSAGQASVRICPVVLQMIKKEGNFFDPDSPNFKGYTEIQDASGDVYNQADFQEASTTPDNLVLANFTTYAINPVYYNRNSPIKKSLIPEKAIAYIDWNAKEGWGANLSYSNVYRFTSPDESIQCGVTKKWTNAWWLTEVGFYHRVGNEYGANFVAMDGHIGWVSSNTISYTNFSKGI